MDGNRHQLIRQLRQLVEDERDAALRAVAELEAYLVGQVQPSRVSDGIAALLSRLSRPPICKDSIRPLVLSSISGTEKSVSQIVAETHLTDRQVRGVLYADDLREKIRKDHSSGPVRFRLASTGGT